MRFWESTSHVILSTSLCFELRVVFVACFPLWPQVPALQHKDAFRVWWSTEATNNECVQNT